MDGVGDFPVSGYKRGYLEEEKSIILILAIYSTDLISTRGALK